MISLEYKQSPGYVNTAVSDIRSVREDQTEMGIKDRYCRRKFTKRPLSRSKADVKKCRSRCRKRRGGRGLCLMANSSSFKKTVCLQGPKHQMHDCLCQLIRFMFEMQSSRPTTAAAQKCLNCPKNEYVAMDYARYCSRRGAVFCTHTGT